MTRNPTALGEEPMWLELSLNPEKGQWFSVKYKLRLWKLTADGPKGIALSTELNLSRMRKDARMWSEFLCVGVRDTTKESVLHPVSVAAGEWS